MLQAISPNTDDLAIARSAAEHLYEKLEDVVRDLNCEYREGVLVLRGRARSFYHKQLAQESVRCLAGVSRVDNRIEVAMRPR